MENVLKNDWGLLLAPEFEKEYYRTLSSFLTEEYSTHVVYPKVEDIFNALQYTSYENTKVVILGQDPYHNRIKRMV